MLVNEPFVKSTPYEPLLELFMNGDSNSQKKSLEALPERIKKKIFYYIRVLPKKSLQTNFKKTCVFYDLSKLQRAAQQVALEALDEEEKISIATTLICKSLGIKNEARIPGGIERTLEKIAPSKRKAVIATTIEFCKELGIKNWIEIPYILKEVAQTAQEAITATIQICKEFEIQGMENAGPILTELKKILPSKIGVIVAATIQFWNELGIDNRPCFWVPTVLEEIAKTLPDEIRAVITATVQICKDFEIQNHYQICSILQEIVKTAAGEKEAVATTTTEFCKKLGIDNSLWCVPNVLEKVAQTAPDERIWALTATVQICNDFGIKNHYEICFLLQEIVKTAAGEKEVVAATATQICKALGTNNAEDVIQILKEMKKVPPGEREETAAATVHISKELGIKDQQSVMPILETLKKAAPGERREVATTSAQICSGLEVRPERRFLVILILSLLPESHRKIVTEPMRQYDPFSKDIDCFADFIRYFLDQDQALRQSWEEYLMTRLGNETNPSVTGPLARIICENRIDFWLPDEHELVRQALNIVIATADLSDAANPYAIYNRIDQARKAPCIHVTQPPKKTPNCIVYFNQKTFVEQIAGPLHFKDLNPSINEKTVKTLVENFEQRTTSLPKEEQDKLKEYVQASYDIGLEACKISLRGSYLKILLRESGKPDKKASFQKAYLVAILEHLLDQSDEITTGQLLSIREEGLLGLASSIQECEIGQAEGIALLYNQLPMKYRYSQQKKAMMRVTENARTQLSRITQRILNDQLSTDNQMIKELTGATGKVEQLPHQVLYMKNLIAQHIGFEHAIQFDQHTHTLYDQLIKRTVEELVTCFYKHLSVGAFVRGLKTAFSENQDLYPLLDCLLTEKYAGKLDLDEIWELDDDDTQVFLTDTGALKVWIAAGYLDQQEAPKPLIN